MSVVAFIMFLMFRHRISAVCVVAKLVEIGQDSFLSCLARLLAPYIRECVFFILFLELASVHSIEGFGHSNLRLIDRWGYRGLWSGLLGHYFIYYVYGGRFSHPMSLFVAGNIVS